MTRSATLAESVAATLRHAIQHGEFICGERLVELSLSHELNVSQNTVRDALSVLEQEGWVVKRARRGVIVRTFTPAEAEELYALWASIEGLALGWGLAALTKNDLMHLRQIVVRMRQHILKGDWSGARESVFALHEAIAVLSSKPQTAQLLMRLHNQGRLLDIIRERRCPRGLYSWQQCSAAYEQLIESIAAQDLPQAQRQLHDLLLTDCAAVLENL